MIIALGFVVWLVALVVSTGAAFNSIEKLLDDRRREQRERDKA